MVWLNLKNLTEFLFGNWNFNLEFKVTNEVLSEASNIMVKLRITRPRFMYFDCNSGWGFTAYEEP